MGAENRTFAHLSGRKLTAGESKSRVSAGHKFKTRLNRYKAYGRKRVGIGGGVGPAAW